MRTLSNHFSHLLRWFRPAVLLLLLLLAALACQSQAPDNPGEPQPSRVLFKDDFSDPTSGWTRVSANNGLTDYDDGVYRILVEQPNTDIWARPQQRFGDISIEVNTFKVSGDRNNRFGVICRLNAPSSFYTFLISSDGYYGIGKVEGSDYSLIGMESMQASEAIEQGAAVNTIRADCLGSTLSLYVNGQKLIEVQDDEFKSGDVGLIAGAYATPGTDIRFDQFTVRLLTAPTTPTP